MTPKNSNTLVVAGDITRFVTALAEKAAGRGYQVAVAGLPRVDQVPQEIRSAGVYYQMQRADVENIRAFHDDLIPVFKGGLGRLLVVSSHIEMWGAKALLNVFFKDLLHRDFPGHFIGSGLLRAIEKEDVALRLLDEFEEGTLPDFPLMPKQGAEEFYGPDAPAFVRRLKA